MEVAAAMPTSPPQPHQCFDFSFCSTPASPRSSSDPLFDFDFHDHNKHLRHLSLLSSEDHCLIIPSIEIPFRWENKPGLSKFSRTVAAAAAAAVNEEKEEENNLEFDFNNSGHLRMRPILSAAEELFDDGIIRPLKPPPSWGNSHCDSHNADSSFSKSPCRFPISKLGQAVSFPRIETGTVNNIFESETVRAKLERTWETDPVSPETKNRQPRGRRRPDEKLPDYSHYYSRRKGISRSLSPLRIAEFALALQEGREELLHQRRPREAFTDSNSNAMPSTAAPTPKSYGRSTKKWRLNDLLLFRSSSEGRATSKPPLNHHQKDAKTTWSFKSIASDMDQSVGSTRSRRQQKWQIPACELRDRAVSEAMKRIKTPLPYKHGLLGCLGFNPA